MEHRDDRNRFRCKCTKVEKSMLKYSRFGIQLYIKLLLVHREISKLKICLLKKSIGAVKWK